MINNLAMSVKSVRGYLGGQMQRLLWNPSEVDLRSGQMNAQKGAFATLRHFTGWVVILRARPVLANAECAPDLGMT